ncbi:MAG TPA: tripartite tricarboxylate transporter substrate binding protein [Xanthobacteraceae bacterium]|jgi:tripartite-type tricarboxylate transporter receptor subunit TctC
MKLPRRQFLRLAASAVAASAVRCAAWAQAYPTRPVHLIVGFATGGTVDIIARLLGQSLAERLGQQFIIENRTGAGSSIAAEAVVRAAPDGYTLLLASSANAVNATFYDNLSFDFTRDVAPIAAVTSTPLVMEVNPLVPATTVQDFIAYAKAHPGRINMASTGSGGGSHIAGELFKMMTGTHMIHVPYRGGGPALTDLLGGQVQVMFDLLPSSIAYIRADKLRALAVTTAMRSQALPDLPVLGDFVPGYEASAWQGIGAPKDTPVEIVDMLNREINAALAESRLKERLGELGAVALSGAPASFGRLIADDTEKWAKVVKFSGAKPD